MAYSLLFRIASGAFLGREQPVFLHIHDLPELQPEARGVAMELDDSAFPLVKGVLVTEDYDEAFANAHFAFLLEVIRKSAGKTEEEEAKLDAQLFCDFGRALGRVAKQSVRVLVLGHMANTNCLLTLTAAKKIKKEQFTAMARLSHNRAIAQLAKKVGVHVSEVQKMAIWGNHSSTMFPDLRNALVAGAPATTLVDKQWINDEFIPTVQTRRKLAHASAVATGAVDHMRDWILGASDWVSMGIPTDICTQTYGVPAGLVFSYPVTCSEGRFQQVKNVEMDKDALEHLKVTTEELIWEREVVKEFLK